jgi:hypothetical protein
MDSGIRSTASRLRWVVIATMGAIILLFLLAQLGVDYPGFRVETREAGTAGARLRAVGTLILLVLAMLRLVQMLGLIAAGELFGADVVRRFRGFAFWLLMMASFDFLAPILAALLAPSPGGERRIAIILDVRALLIVGLTMLLFLVARLLERARELEAEVGEFV